VSEKGAFARVNPIVPLAVVAAGAVLFAFGMRWIGAGVAVGAVLAFVNTLFLSGRVDAAVATGDMGAALLVMQLGLAVTFGIVAVATVIIVHFSVAMAVASAAGFIAAQLALLAAFYWTKGRATISAGRQAS
jgi:hypothetical protein